MPVTMRSNCTKQEQFGREESSSGLFYLSHSKILNVNGDIYNNTERVYLQSKQIIITLLQIIRNKITRDRFS
ncbi:MAG: hypothetical protein ACI90V_010663 [Bacillariaceae sp.]|jgi:hypothetical protein